MNAKRKRLRDKIVRLVERLTHPRVSDKRQLGEALCEWFGFDVVDAICVDKDFNVGLVEMLGRSPDDVMSGSDYRLCMRLSFVCRAGLARKLDAVRVSWRKVVASLSTKLSPDESAAWLEKLVENPSISIDEIKSSYPTGDEQNIRLPKDVDTGCERFRLYALRLAGYTKGLQARLITRRSQRILTTSEAALLSAAEQAGEDLAKEVSAFLAAVKARRYSSAEQPMRHAGSG